MSTITTASGLIIPKLRDYWPGQGGRFVGLHPLGGFAIAAEKFLENEYEFGLYGKKLEGFSDIDGAENTRKLIELGSPAAKAAAEYMADGHSDFYLPAHREMQQTGAVLGFDEDGPAAWTSTPYGSDLAWALDFEYGYVYAWHRSNELAVLLVRRFIPSSL